MAEAGMGLREIWAQAKFGGQADIRAAREPLAWRRGLN